MKPETQIQRLKKEWRQLVAALKKEIQDDFRAHDDSEDDTPSMLLTVGVTVQDGSISWGWQTGDNSFTGGAYGHPFWAVVTLTRTCNSKEIANEIADQILELIYQAEV